MARRTLVYMLLDELERAPRNAKGHDADLITRSVGRFGFMEPIILDERTGKIVAGHGRLDELLRARDAREPAPDGVIVKNRQWTVPVVRGWSSADDVEADAAAVVLNHAVEAGGWETRVLAEVLRDVRDSDRGLDGVGFDDRELDAMLAELARAGEPEPESSVTTEKPKRAFTKLGDIWLLGPHRLICGDARDPEVIDRVLVGARPNMIWTDPPYGIAVDTRFSQLHKPTASSRGGNDYPAVLGDEGLYDARPLIEAFDDVREQFWWGADYYRPTIEPGGGWIVWDKRWDDGMEDTLDAVLGSSRVRRASGSGAAVGGFLRWLGLTPCRRPRRATYCTAGRDRPRLLRRDRRPLRAPHGRRARARAHG